MGSKLYANKIFRFASQKLRKQPELMKTNASEPNWAHEGVGGPLWCCGIAGG
ncbi:MAG TPA: hypothetical protein VGC65_01240 [Bacteroidia bacterium]